MPEKTYFDKNGVLVTNARFISDGKTYAMNTVSSVEVRRQPPEMLGCCVMLAFCGLLLFASAALARGMAVVGCIACGLSMMAFGVVGITKQKVRFVLLLTTSAQEVSVLRSTSKSFVYEVKDAVEESIINRG